MLLPAVDLTSQEAFGFAEVRETDGPRVHLMQDREGVHEPGRDDPGAGGTEFVQVRRPPVRCAGAAFHHVEGGDLAVARKIVEVNCLAALSWAQQVHRLWMSEHGGAVVNVSSVAGVRPAPGIGFYGTSKAMLIHITEELAVELGPNIRVNAVAPAVVKTKFATALYDGRETEVAAVYPLERLGVPEDIGSVVAFLLSADAAWMTGQLLVVDGGVTLTGGS